MSHSVEAPEWRTQYLQEVIVPLAATHEPSTVSLERVRETNSIGIDGPSGGGKGYHMKMLFRLAAELGIPLDKGEQVTTRPPRDAAEANGDSAYEHLDITRAEVREKLEADLRDGKFLQVHVSFSSPDPEGLAVPTDLYATRPEAAILTPGHITAFELVAAETDRLVTEGVLKKAYTIYPTTAFRWLDHLYGRIDALPDNFSGRLDEGISAVGIVRAAVEREQSLPLEERTRLLGLNDYGEGGGVPAYRQVLGMILGNFDPALQQAAYEESEVLGGFMEDLRGGHIRTLDDRIVEPLLIGRR